MAGIRTTRVAYLFGAGATHAELARSFPSLVEDGMGLLTDNVSARVIEKARRERTYLEDLETVSGVRGSLNIELLISLIESAKIHDWDSKTRILKQLVQRDIQAILKPSVVRRFHLQQALSLIPDPRPGNPFAVWLKYKVLKRPTRKGGATQAKTEPKARISLVAILEIRRRNVRRGGLRRGGDTTATDSKWGAAESPRKNHSG